MRASSATVICFYLLYPMHLKYYKSQYTLSWNVIILVGCLKSCDHFQPIRMLLFLLKIFLQDWVQIDDQFVAVSRVLSLSEKNYRHFCCHIRSLLKCSVTGSISVYSFRGEHLSLLGSFSRSVTHCYLIHCSKQQNITLNLIHCCFGQFRQLFCQVQSLKAKIEAYCP